MIMDIKGDISTLTFKVDTISAVGTKLIKKHYIITKNKKNCRLAVLRDVKNVNYRE